MSPISFDDPFKIPYTSHSFNQGILWSNHHNQFIYADHGDGYERGFIISDESGEKNIFHFYLEPNSKDNMYVVNKTFAQQGNISEIGEHLIFVGSSAKSINESAKKERQNLFFQLFDPKKKSKFFHVHRWN